MPHSSGGGSHGGGGHGGGGHGGSGSGVRTSRTYFSGAHKYVYYKNNHPVYYYRSKAYDANAKQISKTAAIPIILFMLFIYLFAMTGIAKSAVNVPKKLSTDYDTTVMIIEMIDVLSDSEEEELKNTFEEFRDKTGVTPALLVVDNNMWKGRYTDLENFAYDAYVNTFADEKHWLIVYSQPEYPDEWVDWYWEGMQGDDTDNIITSQKAKKFNETVQKKLTDNSVSVGRAIDRGFKEIMPDIMKASFNPMVFMVFPFIIFHAACMFYGILVSPVKQRKMQEKSIEIMDAAGTTLEDTCAYCQGVYVHGIHTSCPHCGAPIKASGLPIQPVAAAYADPYATADNPFAEYDKNDPFADIQNGGGFG